MTKRKKRSIERCILDSIKNLQRVFPNRQDEFRPGKSIEIVKRRITPGNDLDMITLTFENGAMYYVTVTKVNPNGPRLKAKYRK